jgi:flagellar protein FlbB
MRPQAAVDILVAMDDQTVIDVLRKVEEMAAASGKSSMGSYWLSLMPSERAAEIQRKMLSKPENLD